MEMLEVAVTLALETIRDLVVEEAKFLGAVDGEVKQLQEELGLIQWFLKDAIAPNVDKERIKAWVNKFQDVAHDIEDVIESYASKNGSQRQRRSSLAKSIRRCICLNEARESHQEGLQIQELSTRISNLKRDFEMYGVKDIIQSGGASSSSRTRKQLRRSYSHVLEEDFVGLESDVEMLVEKLVHGKHKVVSISGMGGLGKTTLAQKIYNHPLVKSHFHAFAWVSVSQEWDTIDLLQRILNKISPHKRDEILKFDEIEQQNSPHKKDEILKFDKIEKLVSELANAKSNNRNFILILDDIWDPNAWESIKKAIHKDAKILLTTRKRHVAEVIGPNGFHHEPRLLNDEECWTLLQKKSLLNTGEVSRGIEDLEALGRQMVKYCEGLPLAVIVLGGILSTNHSKEKWEEVLRNIKYFLGKGKSTIEQQDPASAALEDILTLSYDDLPHRLKPCFLYMAGFPEDASIDAKTLYHMWMAERLVSMEDKMGEEEILINVAERYLGELVQRCMVQVEANISPMIIKFKSCRLHDIMRDLCVKKARDENFLQCIDDDRQRTKLDSRRLVMTIDRHFHPYSCCMANKVRSLQLRINDSIKSSMIPLVKAQLKTCKLLRVLVVTFDFNGLLSKSVGYLSHLKFLYVQGGFYFIHPYALNKLVNLQTLDISEFTGSLPPVLRDLIKLRYLYFPSHVHAVPNDILRLHTLEKLEVLENFDPRYCNAKDLPKLTNLVQFHANIKEMGYYSCEEIIKGISNLSKLRHIRLAINLLKVELTTIRKLFDWGISKLLGDQSTLSRSLKELVLFNLVIVEEEDFMEILENFPNLQKLILCHCEGVREIICHSNSFPQLKLLVLDDFPDLEKWRVDEGAMTKLHRLEIMNLPKLEMIPDGLRFITTLNDLRIGRMKEEFNDRVRVVNGQEGVDFDKIRRVPFIIID